MLRYVLTALCLITSLTCQADTIGRYMNIANNIPKMEMKADKQAHIWARSARTVLSLTSESIAETLMLANTSAEEQGKPMFCLPAGITLNAMMLNELIQQTYREISSQESDKNNMTVSQVALIGVTRKYPCTGGNTKPQGLPSAMINPAPTTPIAHVDGVALPPPPVD